MPHVIIYFFNVSYVRKYVFKTLEKVWNVFGGIFNDSIHTSYKEKKKPTARKKIPGLKSLFACNIYYFTMKQIS